MKSRKTPSIAKQLIGWLMIPITTLCLVVAVATYFIAIRITTQAYDAALMESARELANRLNVKGGQITLDLPAAALAVFKEDNIDTFYYAAIDEDGKIIAGDRDILQSSKFDISGQPRFRNGKINGKSVRIACFNSSVPGQPQTKAMILVAETILKRGALINQILVAVLVPQFVLIGLASLSIWLGVSRGLAPLNAVRAAIASRTPWDLRPVAEVNAPLEIRPLVDAIDDLLGRLNKDIESQRRFVANAAHQLRTPLAGLKTQTELALRQEDIVELKSVLKQIHRGAGNVTRLVNQLLSLARIEPSAARSLTHNSIDLNVVVREATKDMVPYALNKDIDLGFEESYKPGFIIGDAWSVRELVINLIDNAIRYTQLGGKVTVRVEGRDFVYLYVEDDGPGIPESERERVFERFYRVLGNNVTGSGLGLAIVKEIAQNHNAEVSVASALDGKGTTILVKFPAASLSFEPEADERIVVSQVSSPATSVTNAH